eukprot:scaffold23712_cov32-Tisochrysis_lutea.AAC.2
MSDVGGDVRFLSRPGIWTKETTRSRKTAMPARNFASALARWVAEPCARWWSSPTGVPTTGVTGSAARLVLADPPQLCAVLAMLLSLLFRFVKTRVPSVSARPSAASPVRTTLKPSTVAARCSLILGGLLFPPRPRSLGTDNTVFI